MIKAKELRAFVTNANVNSKRPRYLVGPEDLELFIESRKKGGPLPATATKKTRMVVIPASQLHYSED
jgi:hypothetical protein